MKHEPFRTRAGTVAPVAGNRMTDRCRMDADLMRSPGFDDDFRQCRGPIAGLRLKRGSRALALHRRLDDALLPQFPFDNGQVRLPDLAVRERSRKTCRSFGCPGEKNDAARRRVDAMNEPDLAVPEPQQLLQ